MSHVQQPVRVVKTIGAVPTNAGRPATTVLSRMCGRYTHKYTWKQLHRLLRLLTPELPFSARYNVAPSQVAPVVRGGSGGNRLDLLRWGLIPPWAKDEAFGARTVNARAETVASAPAFRDSFKLRRCLVPVSGFYEWQKIDARGKRKQPHYITSSDGEPLMLAGLWSSWNSPEGSPLETFTIITTTPNEMVAMLHDRMPVILDAKDWAAWLDPGVKGGLELQGLFKPYPAELLIAYPVSLRVNSPKNDGPICVEPIPGQVLPPKDESGLFS